MKPLQIYAATLKMLMPQAALYLQTSAKFRTSRNSVCLFIKTYGYFYKKKIKNICNTEFVDISKELRTFCYDFVTGNM